MERPIQPGDFISCGLTVDYMSFYKITSITPGQIDVHSLADPTKRSKVLPIEGIWKLEVCKGEIKYFSQELLIDLLKRNFFTLDPNGANRAASFGNVDILTLMEGQGIFPDQHGASMAATSDNLNVLIWMEKRKLPLPTEHDAEFAEKHKFKNIVDWLAERGIFPPKREYVYILDILDPQGTHEYFAFEEIDDVIKRLKEFMIDYGGEPLTIYKKEYTTEELDIGRRAYNYLKEIDGSEEEESMSIGGRTIELVKTLYIRSTKK